MSKKTYNIRTAGQANIPVLGLGTWQSTGQDCIDVVSQALKMGYEHIDPAQAYDNEKINTLSYKNTITLRIFIYCFMFQNYFFKIM